MAEESLGFGKYVSIGRHTYGIKPSTIILPISANPPQVTIGSFCSFAPGVVMLANAEHNRALPSTFPFRTLLFSTNEERRAAGYFNSDVKSRGSIEVGHDVWVGQNAIILSGVTIGTGAIIGAGAIVSKDVPPYAIVVGNPGRIIKYRFSPDIIDRLLKSKWWELSDETLHSLETFLYGEDVDAFLKQIQTIQKP